MPSRVCCPRMKKRLMTFVERSVHRVGALLKVFDSKSKSLESVVVSTGLKAKLHVLTPRDHERYKLFVFASRDVHDDSAYNPVFELAADEWAETAFLLRNKPTLPEFLQCWLFADSEDEDGIKTQTLLAWNRVRPQQLMRNEPYSLPMHDVEHRLQADLELQLKNTPSSWLPAPSHSRRQIEEQMKAYMDQVNTAYDEHERNDEAYFVYVDTPIGRLPVLSYVVLACQIRQHNEKALRWLEYLLEISACRLHTTADDLLNRPDEWGELIAEMALWQIRARVYTPDWVRVAGDKKVGGDQWARLGCFPDPGLSCGDCEDFSELVLEFVHVFKYCKLGERASPLLQLLQRRLRQYTPFMAIGQLKSGPGYVCHAYVILLDSRWVQNTVDQIVHPSMANVLPALVIEGTAYTESTWSKDTLKMQAEKVRQHQLAQGIMECPTAQSNPERWERILKCKTPAAIVNLERQYGQVSFFN